VYGGFIPLFARRFDEENIALTKIINDSLKKELPEAGCNASNVGSYVDLYFTRDVRDAPVSDEAET